MAQAAKYYPLVLCLILAATLRLVNLGQSFWLDETSQAVLSRTSINQIWFGRSGDFHPPLFYLLAHYWMQLGSSEVWLRLLPVAFGIINVYYLFLFGQTLFEGKRIPFGKFSLSGGLVAAFLLALSPFHIYYSQEFRMYSLLCLLGTISCYLFLRRRFVLLAVVNCLMLYTHYGSIFLIVAQALYWLLYSHQSLKQFIQYALLVILMYLPWLPQFFAQLHSGQEIASYLPGWDQVLSISPLKAFPVIIFKLVAGRINLLSLYLYGSYIVFVFGVTFVSFLLARVMKNFLFTLTLTPIFLMLLTSFWLPQSQPFRVIYILPLLLLIFTGAALRFPKLFLTLILYIFIFGDLAYFTRPRLQREQWRQALEFARGEHLPIVLKTSSVPSPFTWYAPDLDPLPLLSSYPASPESLAGSLPGLSRMDSFLLFEYLTGLTDPGRVVDQALAKNWRIEQISNFEGVGFIYHYAKL